jgi:hypothetical protein
MINAEALKKYFAACPPSGDNPVGKKTSDLILNNVKASLPGSHSGFNLPWRVLLFLYKKMDWEDAVNGILGDQVASPSGHEINPWEEAAVALVCRVICDMDERMLTEKMDKEATERVIGFFNEAVWNRHFKGQLNGTSYETGACAEFGLAALYADVLINCYEAASKPYNDIGMIGPVPFDDDQPAALDAYKSFLKYDPWLGEKKLQYASSTWYDQTWELYHHWVKLVALGISPTDLDNLMEELKQKGLAIPDVVGGSDWFHRYRGWCTFEAITGTTFSDIKGALESGFAAPNPYNPYDTSSAYPNQDAWEFIANGQPGSAFRK